MQEPSIFNMNFYMSLAIIFISLFLSACDKQSTQELASKSSIEEGTVEHKSSDRQLYKNIGLEEFSKVKRIPEKAQDRRLTSYHNFKERSAIANYIIEERFEGDVHTAIDYLENRNKLVIDEYFKSFNKVALSEDKLKAYFEENLSQFSKKEIKASHIFLRKTPSNKNEVEEKIKKIITQYREGVSFVSLIEKFSDKNSAARNDDQVVISQKSNQETVWQALSGLDKNDISLPVYGQRGVSIYKIDEIVQSPEEFENVKNQVAYQLKEASRKNEYNKLKNLIKK